MNPQQVPVSEPREGAATNRPGLARWLIRLPLLGITALILLVFLAIMGVAAHQFQYEGLVYPGVSAFGVKLGGMTKQQALTALSSRYTYGEEAVFTFRDGTKSWQMSAHDLGVTFDPTKTVEDAYTIGRGGNLFTNLISQGDAWMKGHAIQPVVVFDESKATTFLEKLAAGINQPVQEATIVLAGTKVTTTPSQVGREVDIPATLGLLRPVVLNMNTGAEMNLIVKESQPSVKDSEAAGQKVLNAISSPIQIYIEPGTAKDVKDPGPWEVSPDFISGMLSITRVDDGNGNAHYEVSANVQPLKDFLTQVSPKLSVAPVHARFLFNDDTKQLEVITESVDGRALDVDSTMRTIQDTIFKKDSRRVLLVFHTEIPKVSSQSTAEQLGIKELVVQATTFFYGSTDARHTNIQVAAARFHGLVIAPGEQFSFNKYLGDVSPESGYETGLVIFGNQTIAGVGGGVCQVSTTVFQAAFFAGFPIQERYAHGYRVGYYETGTVFANGQKYNSGVGLDATVYNPIVDFKFTNDTPYYLLMESVYRANEQSLTFKFYSTATGRVVTKDGPTLSNVVPHGPNHYQENKDLAPGQQRQVDYAVDGVDAHVYRTITLNGQVIVNREDFYSHYLPWSAVFQVAPGHAPQTATGQ